MGDAKYFPGNYDESQRLFRELAAKTGGELGQWKIPSREDPDLSVDHLWLPASKSRKRLCVITSGIHGSEGYAGAAIQRLFMEEILATVDRAHNSLFIVHAMNPYGFKYHRRGSNPLQ